MKEIKLPATGELEQAILGGMLCSITVLNRGVLELSEAYFGDTRNQLIFRSCKKLYLKGVAVTAAMVIAELREEEVLRYMGPAYLADLETRYDSGLDYPYLFDRLRRHGLRKAFLEHSRSSMEDLADPNADVYEVMAHWQDRITKLQLSKDSTTTSASDLIGTFEKGMSFIQYIEDVHERVKRGERAYEGFSSGYKQLDELIGGFMNGTVTMIGARTSMGKTTAMMNFIANIVEANPDARLGIFSLEMRLQSLLKRWVCMRAGVSISRVEQALCSFEEIERLRSVVPEIKAFGSRVLMEGNTGTISEIQARIKRMISTKGVNIIFIDYLTRIEASRKTENNHFNVDQISKGLQTTALEMEIPLICLAQLNRNLTKRPDNRPQLSDFRESGSIEEDADTAIMIHRPKMLDNNLPNDFTEFHVCKNRLLGELGKIELEFKYGKLIELPKKKDMLNNAPFKQFTP